ncbi:MAG: GNAT family N-acetyltransferase [Chthoniobacterales bacterium]|nr:GNAT family N-acetyltransferase [Chthoniobacterales bacterium]
MRDAIERRKLSRLVAIVAPHNAASVRLLRKLGFQLEKKIRLTPDDDDLLLFAISSGAC